MSDNLSFYLGFSHFLGIGPIKLNALLKEYDIEKAYGLSESSLAKIVGPQTSRKFVEFRLTFDPVKRLLELKAKQIEVVSRIDTRYPDQLRNISDAPICLYVKGDSSCLVKSGAFNFAIVGTRKASTYGLKTTREIVAELLRRNRAACIVSGLAYGIDAVAHEMALDMGGKTVAFLGCGVDIVYPYGNKKLYDRIIAEGGAIVSEFPPGQTVVPGLFIARNRLISGFSKGVLVVEGSKTSGAMITARYAAEQGKDVFALPGQINTSTSEAPHILIKEGAIITTTSSDICDYYGFGIGLPQQDDLSPSLSTEELTLYRIIDTSPKLLDEIVAELKSPVQEVLMVLSRLEMEGVVERRTDEKYSAKVVHRV